jgi:ABC-type microcin C transport system permease subunit YejB
MGRRVYAGLIVVLVSAMVQGLKPERVARLREALGIDRRTLERWHQWWRVTFVESSFWRAARARFMPPLYQRTLPWSLCLSFQVERRDRLLELLKFLAPITTPLAWQELVM